MILTSQQEEAKNSIVDWFNNHSKEKQVFTLSGFAGTGKAQLNNTNIPTPSGIKKLGDLKVGDFVFDRLGKPTKVLGVFPQGVLDVYRVELVDGRITYCNNEHLWSYYNDDNKLETATTQVLLDNGVKYKEDKKIGYKYAIPVNNSVEYKYKKCPIDPILLGIFLGSDYFKEKYLCLSASKISLNCLNLILCKTGYHYVQCNDRIYFKKRRHSHALIKASTFFRKLKEYKRMTPSNKYIPEEYLHNLSGIRNDVLSGIFSINGDIYRTSSRIFKVRYSSKSLTFLNSICDMMCSLGYYSNKNNILRNKKIVLPYYDMDIDIPNELINFFFYLSNKEVLVKKASSVKNKIDFSRIYIKKIEKVNYKEQMTCIKVDNPEELYLSNDFIVTHNTTLINYIIKNELGLQQEEVAFATPTGKAASVLLQKGASATTIHRLIYTTIEKEYKIKLNNKEITSKKIEFIKKPSIGNYKLIVLDEISMVNKKVMADLLSYGIPILATGDLGQLPPVASEENSLLFNPDYNLTDIVRQNEDNAILDIATAARLGNNINFGNYNDQVIVIDRNTLTNDMFKYYLTHCDKIICGLNKTKIKLNKLMRTYLGHTSPLPEDNEVITCDLNNYEIVYEDQYPLVNGMMGYIKDFKIVDEKLKLATISFKPDFLDKYNINILIDYNMFQNDSFLYDKHTLAYIFTDGSFDIRRFNFKKNENESKKSYYNRLCNEYEKRHRALGDFMINQFEYGYVCSCHKAQGSEWDTVVVIDEHKAFGADANKWLYTACTRAKKKLIIIK